MSALNWTAFNFLTGKILLDSAAITWDGSELPDTIGQVDTINVVLNLDAKTPSPDWIFATEKGAAAWVAWTGTPLNPVIVWGGIVTQRVRTLGPQVALQLATAEAYLDACPVSNYVATSFNQDKIVYDLVTLFAAGTQQPSWATLPSANPSSVTQSVAYPVNANVSVLGALQALSATQTSGINGPEWFCGWQWNLATSTIVPTITYGQRVGHVASAAGPNVTIELAELADGSQFIEDYTAGRGANVVTALGQSTGGSTTGVIPSATVSASNFAGRPTWTYTFSPSEQTSDTTILAGYASRALAALQSGNQPLVAVLPANQPGRTYGVDWFLGDDIGWNLHGGLQFPIAVSGIGRVIGVKVTASTVSPVIQGAVLS